MGSKIALIGGLSVLFVMTVLVMLRVLPGPHKSTDYLVIGTFATFFCLGVLFLVSVVTGGDTKDVFFKKRKDR